MPSNSSLAARHQDSDATGKAFQELWFVIHWYVESAQVHLQVNLPPYFILEHVVSSVISEQEVYPDVIAGIGPSWHA